MHLDVLMQRCYYVDMTTRTTITINEKLLHVLKQRALDNDKTVSAIIEDAVKQQILEDIEDLETIEARKNEPTYTHEEFVALLKAEGLL